MEMKRKANGKQVRGTYISHRIQNELIDLVGEFLEQCVIDRVKSCWFFSILADECRDSAGKQQLALFFRYVWFDPISSVYSVEEDFVQFLHCPRLSGEALFNILVSYVNRNQIPMHK